MYNIDIDGPYDQPFREKNMPADIRKELGQRLRTLRRRRGFTQEDMAKRCGLHWTYIGGLERGERNPTLTTLQKITDGLSVSLFELLDRRSPVQAGGSREKKEGRLMRLLRRKDDTALDLAAGIVKEVLSWSDRHGGERRGAKTAKKLTSA